MTTEPQKSSEITSLLMVGPFPPPRHGLSAVNEAVRGLATTAGCPPIVFDTAATGRGAGVKVRALRLWRVLSLMRHFRTTIGRHPGCTVYISLSGGWGLLYDWLFVVIARRCRRSLILHHHSFRYVDRTFWPMARVVTVAGPEALHVFLCGGMRDKFLARYPVARRSLVLSNAGLLRPTPRATDTELCELRTVGYLSNISVAKGLVHLLDLAERAERWLPGLEFVLAGPFESVADEAIFRARASHLSNVRHIGPVYGAAKDDFFSGVQVFLFPTCYVNEAEPLVIHEALLGGCAVIAYDRGCISGLVDDDVGALIAQEGNFSEEALTLLRRWRNGPSELMRLRASASAKAEALRLSSDKALKEFKAALKGAD